MLIPILTHNSVQAIQIFSNAPSTPVAHTLTYILILSLRIRLFIHNFTNHITKSLDQTYNNTIFSLYQFTPFTFTTSPLPVDRIDTIGA